jgi:hypothetical protein
VDFNEDPLNQSIGIVVTAKVCPQHCTLIEIQHCVVEELWMAQNTATLSNQMQMTFGSRKIQLEMEEIFVGAGNN